MNLKVILTITAVIGVLFGLGFIFLPQTLMDMYLDNAMTEEHVFLTRLYGSSSLFVGFVAFVGLWFQGNKEKRLITYALIGFMLPHSILFVYGTVTGGINSMGWVMVGVTGIQALLYALSLRSTGK